MLTLELTIQRKTDDGWPLIAEQIQPGLLPVRNEGLLRLDQTELLSQITPHEYGVVLGQAVFQGPIRDALVRALTESADGIRLLCFVEAPDLRSLRWERLCAPVGPGSDQPGNSGWDFLALNQRTLFSLYLPSVTDRSYPPIGRRDLRALVLIASPGGLEQYGLTHFDVGAAAARVRAALGSIPYDLLASGGDGPLPDALGPASVEALCQQLTVLPYTLLHVICHGQFDRKSGETSLFLANQQHQLEWTEGKSLLLRLGRLRGQRGLPYLTFFATCDSAAPEAEGALGGLAQRLVRDLGMPAVIAMTEKVSIVTADQLTTHFYSQLQTHGEVDRALVEATIATAKRSDVTVPVIYSRLGGQPLFSRSLDRELTNAEISYGLDTLQPLLDERAPVLRPRFDPAAATLRRYLTADLPTLGADALAERQAALAAIEQITTKAVEVSFKAFSLDYNPPRYDVRCPFLGLVAFGAGDHQFFFGREPLIQQVRQQLAQSPFLAILGPSGSGKSSLVLAGLLPALQQANPALRCQVMTPGADPLVALKAASEKLLVEAPPATVSITSALLVVDQFEESFTLCTEEAKRRAFFQQLLALVASPPDAAVTTTATTPPVALILTMRADFWGDCAAYPHLRDQMLAQQLLIPPMNSDELRAAIEQQARTVGLRFEADLANTILDDVAGEPGAMPLLQHALRELWQRRYGRWLVAAEYRAMGGVKQALAGSAETIYQGLAAPAQQQMRTILLRLTRLDEEALPGETRRDTRRRVSLADLAPVTAEGTSVSALIQQLTDARLLVTNYNAVTARDEVEVAHEALIREWPRLQSWLAADLEGLRLQRQVAAAIQQWQAHQQDPSFLFQGRRLHLVQAWAQEHPTLLNAQEQAFVAASSRRERLALVRTWGSRTALVLLPVLVALGVMWLGRSGLFAEPMVAWQRVDAIDREPKALAWDASGALYVGMRSRPEDAEPRSLAISQDEGKSWRYAPLPTAGVAHIISDPFVPGLVYVVSNNLELWRTTDQGSTWITLTTPISQVSDVTISGEQALYALLGDRALYSSLDRGENWRALVDGPESIINFIKWIDGRLIVGCEDGLWFWSPAAGWQSQLGADLLFVVDALKLGDQWWVADAFGVHILQEATASQHWSNDETRQLVGVERASPIVIAATASDLLWWSTDGQITKTIATRADFAGADLIQTMRLDPRQPERLWVVTNAGLYQGDLQEMLAE